MKRILGVCAAVTAIAVTGACSITGDELADPSMTTLRYEGGITKGSKFKECLDEGEKLASDDKFYAYPKTQRESVWDSDNYIEDTNDDQLPEGSADYPDLKVLDKDGRTVYVKAKVSFFLNTDCSPKEINGKTYPGGTIQYFHETVGKTRNAYFTDGKYAYGWIWAMTNYLANPVQDYIKREAKTHTAENMFKSTELQDEIQSGLAEALPNLVNAGMETDEQFYQNFTVKIFSITPEEEYLNLLKERDNAKVKAETAQANAEAQVAEAAAQTQVEQQKALTLQAIIAGYGSVEAYLKYQAIEHGINPYQPTGSLVTTK